MAASTQQVAFRLSPELVARVDAYAQRMTERTPGLHATRADAVRVLLEKALNAEGVPKHKRDAPR